MAARKTRFTLLGFETAKAIQILGSWNGYSEYLALVRDEDSTAWKGTFPLALQPGQHRYHYLIDGCHYHVPSDPSAYEPKIGKNVNILNIQRQSNSDIPQGRPLPTSAIVAPSPYLPSSREPGNILHWKALNQCCCEFYAIMSNGTRMKMSCEGSLCGKCDEE